MTKSTLLKVLVATMLLFNSNAQSDGCTNATVIDVTANCLAPSSGTTTGATQTIAGCAGNADDDVWYQFVATSTSHQIIVSPSAGMDPVVQLFSGGCGVLISLVCKDNGLTGDDEVINYSSLTIGLTYRVRIYDYFAGAGTGDFTICITTPPAPPSNNICSTPTLLNVNSSCSYTTATTDGATQSFVGCAGNADDDVWFQFVATNSLQNITVSPIDNLDLVFQVYLGSCASLTSLACIDNTLTSQNEQSDIVGLIPGQTYLIRVYDYFDGTTGDFQICVTGTPTPAPTNDDPCSAIQLPDVTATCVYSQFTTVGATNTTGVSTPNSCVGGSAPQEGGFGTGTQDVWFAITVPSSGQLDITPQPNGGAGAISDAVMVLYSGTCGSLTQIACSDDHNFPGSANDFLPLISESGLTPGSTVYLRYFDWGIGAGTFGICASTTTNDECVNALYICDINGYSASTSASYTPDRPDNMFANNETSTGTNLADGINSGGPFGQAGPWGAGSPFFDVIINNNSWVRFTASATTATLTVNVFDCWVGNYPSGGIQMQIFEADNCTNFIPVSNYEESSTGFVITANNLTIGNDYYLMVDGFAGDICNYTITADSGVQFPEIVPVPPICAGESVTLTAPPGATSYLWAHSGEITQTVIVTPSTTISYSTEVTGLCDYKQTLNVTVQVIPNPIVSITNGANFSICNGDNINLISTGATSYVWNTLETGNTINVSPSTLTVYNVTGTTNGCSDAATITVAINPDPTLTANPTALPSDCGASNGALNGVIANGTPTLIYSWSNGVSVVGNSVNLTNIPAGDYYLTVTDGNTCSAVFGPFNVSNPGAPIAPTVTIDDDTPCLNASAQLSVSGVAGATFAWTGPNSFTSSNSVIDLPGITSLQEGNYCVSQTVAGCTGPSACQLITVNPLPSVDISALNNDSTICMDDDIILTASGATSYSWTGPNGFTGNSPVETIVNATLINDGTYNVIGTDANGCINSASIPISILNLPTLSLDADDANETYCLGFIAILSATGADIYSWTGPNGFNALSDTVIVLNLNAQSEGYYVVQGIDIEGCINEDSILLNVVLDVPVNTGEDESLCPGASFTLSGSGGFTYAWSGPGNFFSTEQSPVVSTDLSFLDNGYYVLAVTDVNGCLGFDSTLLTVENSAKCLLIPNLMTPNNDGENDEWEILGLDKFEDVEVSIFNRWGNLIYYSSPYKNNWIGEVNKGATIGAKDGIVPPGTYFYIIDLKEGDPENDIFKGYVEVEY